MWVGGWVIVHLPLRKCVPALPRPMGVRLGRLALQKLLVYYLLRSPAFDTVCEPTVQALVAKLEAVPGVSSLASLLLGSLSYYHERYFYCSGS